MTNELLARIELLQKENKELQNKIDKLKSFIITNKPVYIEQKGKPCIINVANDLLEILKDSDVDEPKE